jgi:hypothetical protein
MPEGNNKVLIVQWVPGLATPLHTYFLLYTIFYVSVISQWKSKGANQRLIQLPNRSSKFSIPS